MTIPPVPTQAAQLRASQAVPKVGNPFFRYLLGALLMLFSMGWAILLIVQKQTPSTIDGAVILVPLLFGLAVVTPGTFTLVAATLKPLIPWGRHDS